MTFSSEKLSRLINVLGKARVVFESMSDEIGDLHLRSALSGIATDIYFFAREIFLQLNDQDLLPELDRVRSIEEYEIDGGRFTEKGEEVAAICKYTENQVIGSYEELLNDSMHLSRIKQILAFQLGSLQLGFARVRLLNEERFSA